VENATFRVLGGVEVRASDGGLVGPAGARQRLLLALLLAARGSVVSADRLVDALWPASQPLNSSAALHSHVSRLRAVLGRAGLDRSALVSRADGYLLAVPDDAVDAERFEALRDEAVGQPPSRAASTLTTALALWRGDAYSGVEDLAVRAEAVRLDEARLIAAEARAAALVAAGRSADAVPGLETFVAAHPLREEARATLMHALYSTGRQADALRHFDQYRRSLADELGLEPSARLTRLQQLVLTHDPSLSPAPAVPATPAPVPGPRDPSPGHMRPGGVERAGGLEVLHRRFVTVGTARVAWAETGVGLPVVALPGWLSDLDVIASGRDPRSSLLERLGRRERLVLYDRAGTGRSRDSAADPSLEHAVAELAAVVDSAGPPAVLLAMSQAGPVALRYAAEYPEHVLGLVLFGTYASGPATFSDPELREALVTLVRTHWGLGSDLLAGLYRPGAGPEAATHLARVLRDSASAEVAAQLLDGLYRADASDVLADVTAPTLVVHYRRDRLMPFAAGEALAEALRNARMLALEGRYHLPDAQDLDLIEAEVAQLIDEVATRASTA
jgi:DNA-binding SARP family transcriptional activator/pimeloyl-ACP methyl ester carboxylesterase